MSVPVFACYSIYNDGLAVCDKGRLENERRFHHIRLLVHDIGHVVDLIDAARDHS